MITKTHPGKYILKATLLGFLLGLGAPLGYVFHGYFFLNPESQNFFKFLFNFIVSQNTTILYITLPVVTVFMLFGLYHGRLEKALSLKEWQMDHFMHIVVHDIRSPLSVMIEGATLLKDGFLGPLNEKQSKFVRIIQRQGMAMTKLVTEILDIHKMESGQYELKAKPTEILPLVRRAVDEMALMIDKKEGHIEVKSEISEKTQIFVDAFRIRQVLRNILSNALKFMPEKSTISITLDRNDKSELEVVVFNKGGLIPKDKVKKIFDKYIQADDRSQKLGYGLGLSICKNIMELHEGHIWAENIEPETVAFHLAFPGKLMVNF